VNTIDRIEEGRRIRMVRRTVVVGEGRIDAERDRNSCAAVGRLWSR
jgi:hypothetical protein